MKRVAIFLVLIFSAWVGFALEEPQLVQIEGEVVDMRCYTTRGARGADHQECAARCLKNGQPAGIVIGDGDLLTIVGSGQAFSPYAAKTVKLEGKRQEHTIVAEKMWVWENEAWKAVALKYGAPETAASEMH